MKLDYATLISPYPLRLQNIGSIKSPTLREIWNPDVTYQTYNIYLSLLLTDLQMYCEKVDITRADWYHGLSDEEKEKINMFDIISEDNDMSEQYRQVLDFFFVENVIWDNYTKMYYTYLEKDDNGIPVPIGVIHGGIWCELCDVILQRCGVNRDQDSNINESKVKSKRALSILKKIKQGKEKLAQTSKHDKDINLPNLIAKVSVMAKSINYINIWDLTVYQIYEQFRQECSNVYFDMSKMSVAAWGNEKKTFNGNEWYKTNE